MGPKKITLNSRALEFKDDFYKDNNKLMCRFCHHSVDYTIHSKITAHIESKGHKQKKDTAEHTNNPTRQLTLTTTMQAAESRKGLVG
ncbi:16745_t:CDS:2 [Cetraspora pellucida]|uniref:16745_t:CDS:1 n=1 Tax=Cetraspora pellucida TaxID=1433469 RepID=A0ACA9K2H4_9GLOM|nr:16745_t:CDS:2 [Cetraspora pellucida]